MVVTAAGATDSNVVGMIGTKAGLSMKNAAMEATTLQLQDLPGWHRFWDHMTSLFQISSLAFHSIVQHSTHTVWPTSVAAAPAKCQMKLEPELTTTLAELSRNWLSRPF